MADNSNRTSLQTHGGRHAGNTGRPRPGRLPGGGARLHPAQTNGIVGKRKAAAVDWGPLETAAGAEPEAEIRAERGASAAARCSCVPVAVGHVPRKVRLEAAAAVKLKATVSASPFVSAPLAPRERRYS